MSVHIIGRDPVIERLACACCTSCVLRAKCQNVPRTTSVVVARASMPKFANVTGNIFLEAAARSILANQRLNMARSSYTYRRRGIRPYRRTRLVGTKSSYYRRYGRRPAYRYRRRYSRRRPMARSRLRAAPRRRTTLRRKVYRVQRVQGATIGHHTHKIRSAFEQAAAIKSCAYRTCGVLTTAQITSAIANLRVYDPSTATLVTVDWGAGTYQRDIMVDNMYSKIEVRNNYHVPVKVRVYYCATKHDADSGPATSYSNGIADQTTGPSTTTDPLVYPTEID